MLQTKEPIKIKIFTDVTIINVAIWLLSRKKKKKKNENIQIEKNE